MRTSLSFFRARLADLVRVRQPARVSAVHLAATMEWLCRAHDAAAGGGVARSYSLCVRLAHGRRGWLAAYPETTGYIIPTFLDYAALDGREEFRRRAIRMAEWEIEVQMESGAVQAGDVSFPPSPAVFNTGQVLFGWCRAFTETGDSCFQKAALRAADFMLDMQDPDGAWRRGGSQRTRQQGVHAYDARSAWGLLEVHRITGDARYRDAAVRNLDFVLTCQAPNGWFANACLSDNERPLLHTVAYTMEGLLEGGARLGVARYVEGAGRAASALVARLRPDGSLAGRFDREWRPMARWSCLTGEAQTAVVCLRLFQLTGDSSYREAAQQLITHLKTTHDLRARDPGVRGGMKGSHPIWGPYHSYEYPNWAAKFFADALLLEGAVAANSPAPGRPS
jgi:hypothetical protein